MKRLLPYSIVGLTLIVLAMASLPRPSQAQEGDLRGLVQQTLITQLGYDPTLLEFSFVGRTWEDSSLGCPVVGQTYTPGPISGYQWFFLMGDGVRYSLHTDLGGGQIILCAATSEITFTYSAYSGSYFTLNHPNLWSVQTANQTEVAFLWRGQAGCSLPETRVFVLANLSDAASVLDSYYSTIGLPLDRNRYSPSPLGLTSQHRADCAGIPRQVQATGIAQGNNTAYLILQSAPVNVFEVWAGPFAVMLESFAASTNPLTGSGASLAGLAGSAIPTATPSPDPASLPSATPAPATLAPVAAITVPTLIPTFTPTPAPTGPNPPPIVIEVDLASYPVAHVFLGEVHIGALNNLPGIRLERRAGLRSHLRASQDGQQLAWIENGAILKTASLTAPLDDNELVEDAFGRFPPAWAVDQPALAYLADTGNTDEAGQRLLEVRTIAPDNSRASLGPLPFRDDCPSEESPYLLDGLLARETSNGLLFEWLPNGQFLYSTACDGVGLALFDPASGQVTALGQALSKAVLAPNGQLLAALDEAGQAHVVDLLTLESRPLTTSTTPDVLGWDVTSTQVFFSTRFPNDPLLLDDPALQAQAEATLGVFPYESRLNNLRVFQVDINNGFEVQLWEGTGFAIGNLQGLPDGNALLFTLIPSDRTWLTNFINNATPNILRNSQPETELYLLPSVNAAQPQAGGARLLAITSQLVLGRPLPTAP